jgi:hypothetical protein
LGKLESGVKMYRVYKDEVAWFDEDDNLHREGDLPAIVRNDGTRGWFRHGKAHRDGDKPAVERADGSRAWWVNDVVHREAVDEQGEPLPAIICKSGTKWVRNGVFSNPGHDWVAKLPDGTKGYYRDSALHFDNGEIHTLRDDVFTYEIIRPVDDEKSSIEELKCTVCMENKRCIAFNCGHFVTCASCSQRLNTCPMCRVKISTKTRIYM